MCLPHDLLASSVYACSQMTDYFIKNISGSNSASDCDRFTQSAWNETEYFLWYFIYTPFFFFLFYNFFFTFFSILKNVFYLMVFLLCLTSTIFWAGRLYQYPPDWLSTRKNLRMNSSSLDIETWEVNSFAWGNVVVQLCSVWRMKLPFLLLPSQIEIHTLNVYLAVRTEAVVQR